MNNRKNLTLNNHVDIPMLGLGTWLIDNDKAAKAVKTAFECGYRHIDTAQAYGNETGVGQGLKESHIKRKDAFITSKIAAEIKDYKTAKESIEISLKKLDTDYIDLMLIHCVQPWSDWVQKNPYRYEKENLEVWRAMEEAYKEGKIKAIGVSNFNEYDIQNILDNAEIKPSVNQICLHIGHTPLKLVKWCQERDITIEAYSPIAHGKALNDPLLQSFADKYQITIPELCINYCLQIGCIALPKASSKEHMLENMRNDIVIDEEDQQKLLFLE